MTFEQTPEQRAELLAKAIDFAGGYARSFAPEVLQHLYRSIVEHTLPPTASLQEHAELNGQRKLVIGIIRQYQLATTGNTDTPWQTIPAQPQQQPAAPPKQAPQRANRQQRQKRQRS